MSLTETDIKILQNGDIMPLQLVMPNFYVTWNTMDEFWWAISNGENKRPQIHHLSKYSRWREQH